MGLMRVEGGAESGTRLGRVFGLGGTVLVAGRMFWEGWLHHAGLGYIPW